MEIEKENRGGGGNKNLISDKEAEVLLLKAKRELRTAKRNLEDELYPEAVFDAQRAAEKAIKAAIRITGHEYGKDHDPSGLFGRIMLKELNEKIPSQLLKEVPKLGKAMNKLAKLRFLVEYPLEEEGEIIPPWEQVDSKTAEEAIKSTEAIILWVEKFLKWWKSAPKMCIKEN